MDKNIVILQGRIGSVVKEGKTQNGNMFLYFGMDIESRSNATSTENNYKQTLKVMCFKPKVIEYLRKLKVHSGMHCIVFGFMSSFMDEVKGKPMLVNALNCNECYIIQMRPYDEDKGK
jgi:hypothetical protein